MVGVAELPLDEVIEALLLAAQQIELVGALGGIGARRSRWAPRMPDARVPRIVRGGLSRVAAGYRHRPGVAGGIP